MKIAIITQEKYVDPTTIDWYTEQVLTEDGLMSKALEKRGIETVKVAWSDPNFNWELVDAAIFRSTWDYFYRFEEFTAWLERVKNQTKFINPIEQVKWNMDKHYLIDLKNKGIPIVESYFIEIGSKISLVELHQKLGWNKTVLKPCISGGGKHTYLLDPENYLKHEEVFQEVISKEAMMLQPYQELITEKGEISLIVIAGKHTHSVLKKAKEGDYRVQDDFGGTVHPYSPTKDEIDFAENVARACYPLPFYARIDIIWDNKGEMVISEVELIEPELWFRRYSEAADSLANAIVNSLRD
ncbi:MAG: hypothetical protein H6582_08050 [Crocinitomicaceae bacterium]|nr:hypothetical protein [Crocinitomicaceae bacterium]